MTMTHFNTLIHLSVILAIPFALALILKDWPLIRAWVKQWRAC